MSALTQVHIEEALESYIIPHLNRSLMNSGAIKSVQIEDTSVSITIELGFPVASIQANIENDIIDLVRDLNGVESVDIIINSAIASIKGQQTERCLEKVKNIVAVASGKGGVGKSTTAVNLALALLKEGANVGLLDADIYGPSQQLMLGFKEGVRPEQQGQYLMPIEAHGLKTMSMGCLVTDKTPMVWRGPMAGGALTQLLTQTWWGELDYLIIDMPPGTGDIQLTLSQKASVAGAVIVTTPQDIALLDAQKGIEMFRKVEVPVLGVVENMAIHICTECGHKEHIFGEGGGNRIAEDYDVPVLGSLPLSLQVREQVDAGNPTVAADPDGDIAKLYGDIARNMAAQLSLQAARGPVQVFPNIVMSDD